MYYYDKRQRQYEACAAAEQTRKQGRPQNLFPSGGGRVYGQDAAGYERKRPCRGMYMRVEEIDRERERSGWNPYLGEEEEGADGQRVPSGQELPESRERSGMMEQEKSREQSGMPERKESRERSGMMERKESREQSGMPEQEKRGWNPYLGKEKEGADGQRVPAGQELPESREQSGMPEEEEGQIWSDQPTPYYEIPDYPDILADQKLLERDLQRMQSMYPQAAKLLLPHIGEACDKMEYEGSPMYDERPDLETVRRISREIQEKVKDQYPPEPEMTPEDMMFMQYQGRRNPPGRNWLGDLVQVMLLQEMYRRRCRRHKCSGWRR